MRIESAATASATTTNARSTVPMPRTSRPAAADEQPSSKSASLPASAAVSFLSAALVREWLSRNGYKEALVALDSLRPPSADDLSSRTHVAAALGLQEELRRNRRRSKPLSSMIEILVEGLIDRERCASIKPLQRANANAAAPLRQGGVRAILAPEAASAACARLGEEGEAGDGSPEAQMQRSEQIDDGQAGARTRARRDVAAAGGAPVGPAQLDGRVRIRSRAANMGLVRLPAETTASRRPMCARNAREGAAHAARGTGHVGGAQDAAACASGAVFEGASCAELPAASKAISERRRVSETPEQRAHGNVAEEEEEEEQQQQKHRAAHESSSLLHDGLFSISNRKHEKIVVTDGQVAGGCVELLDLSDCEVFIMDWSSQVTVERCHSCVLFFGPVDGSLFVRESSSTTLAAVCRQFRSRDCRLIDAYLHTRGPVIESSSAMRFGAWACTYAALPRHLSCARLRGDAMSNCYSRVHDFSADDAGLSLPHFSLIGLGGDANEGGQERGCRDGGGGGDSGGEGIGGGDRGRGGGLYPGDGSACSVFDRRSDGTGGFGGTAVSIFDGKEGLRWIDAASQFASDHVKASVGSAHGANAALRHTAAQAEARVDAGRNDGGSEGGRVNGRAGGGGRGKIGDDAESGEGGDSSEPQDVELSPDAFRAAAHHLAPRQGDHDAAASADARRTGLNEKEKAAEPSSLSLNSRRRRPASAKRGVRTPNRVSSATMATVHGEGISFDDLGSGGSRTSGAWGKVSDGERREHHSHPDEKETHTSEHALTTSACNMPGPQREAFVSASTLAAKSNDAFGSRGQEHLAQSRSTSKGAVADDLMLVEELEDTVEPFAAVATEQVPAALERVPAAPERVPAERPSAPLALDRGEALSAEDRAQLFRLFLGDEKGDFNGAWTEEGLSFCSYAALPFGLEQRRGGTCGLVAAVQALLLRRLLFAQPSTRAATCKEAALDLLSTVDETTRWEALLDALCDVLCPQSVYEGEGVNCDGSGEAGSLKQRCIKLLVCTDGALRSRWSAGMRVHSFSRRDGLRAFLQPRLHGFCAPGGGGAALLALSAALCRGGAAAVAADMDCTATPLITPHAYCSQELVSLLITGFAHSNVFDGTKSVGDGGSQDLVLRGVLSTPQIGLLAHAEHFGHCTVGNRFKCPACPVWLCCMESHYSVLFAVDSIVAADSVQGCESLEGSNGSADAGPTDQPAFDLFYYDQLGRQEEIITITVRPGQAAAQSRYDYGLVPPLDETIRTRWPDAAIDWNGAEPLL